MLTDADAAGTVRTPLRNLMHSTGLEQRIGAGNFHLRVEDAVAAFSRRRG